MSASDAPAGVDSPTPGAPRAADVADFCNALNRACRGVRFYPPDHPVVTESIDLLHRTAHMLLAERQEIVLEVKESSLDFEGCLTRGPDKGTEVDLSDRDDLGRYICTAQCVHNPDNQGLLPAVAPQNPSQ